MGARLVGVLAVFLIAVACVMVMGQVRQSREEPWRSPELAAAQARLHGDPKNEALKAEVRELDRDLRWGYFRSLERNRVGAWMLLWTGVLLVLVARFWGTQTPWFRARMGSWVGGTDREPRSGSMNRDGSADTLVGPAGVCRHPADKSVRAPVSKVRDAEGAWVAPDREATLRGTGRTLLGVAVIWMALMMVIGLFLGVRLPDGGRGGSEVAAEASKQGGAQVAATGDGVGVSREDLARNWTQFRGYDGSGRVAVSGVPLSWDVKAGEGVAWKSAIALKGYSSPVIWKDRVFLTGGNRAQRRVFAFDGATGAALWAQPVIPTNAVEVAIQPPDQSGQAASSPATDGERVFAIFATGELGALDFKGNHLWSHRLDFTENGYGHAASLVVWNDRLFVQDDQGAPEDGKSTLRAFETRTGKVLWVAKRPVGGSWTTPVVFEAGGRWQVVTAGDPWLMGHDARTGVELWRAHVLGGELAPSPIFADGHVVVASPGHTLAMLRVDGSGDVTKTHVIWQTSEGVPDVPTPTRVGGLLFSADTEGNVICRDAATGEKVWEHEFELEIQASPLVVGDRIYLFGQPGSVRVVRAGRTFESLAAFEMEEDIYATPAIAGDRLYVRTEKNLYSIGTSSGGAGGGTNDVR